MANETVKNAGSQDTVKGASQDTVKGKGNGQGNGASQDTGSQDTGTGKGSQGAPVYTLRSARRVVHKRFPNTVSKTTVSIEADGNGETARLALKGRFEGAAQEVSDTLAALPGESSITFVSSENVRHNDKTNNIGCAYILQGAIDAKLAK